MTILIRRLTVGEMALRNDVSKVCRCYRVHYGTPLEIRGAFDGLDHVSVIYTTPLLESLSFTFYGTKAAPENRL